MPPKTSRPETQLSLHEMLDMDLGMQGTSNNIWCETQDVQPTRVPNYLRLQRDCDDSGAGIERHAKPAHKQEPRMGPKAWVTAIPAYNTYTRKTNFRLHVNA